MEQKPEARLLMTAHEVADLLGVTSAWVYAQSRAGKIPTVKLGRRYYRYRRRLSGKGVTVTRLRAAVV